MSNRCPPRPLPPSCAYYYFVHKHSINWVHSHTHVLFHHTLHHYGIKYHAPSHLHNLGATERGLERPQPPDYQQTNSVLGSHGERHMYVQANKYEINARLL